MNSDFYSRKVFSLFDITILIQETIAIGFPDTYWIKAEMNKLNHYPHSGHCYPDLVEKRDGKVIAQMRANLWRDDYHRINDLFTKIVKEPLKNGIKILFLAQVTFRPEYGLALRIIDIDPSFTLGDIEKEKQETLRRLKQKGIYDRNRELQMPLLPQRIAIISVETSNGYADFLQVLQGAKESWGYHFFHMLFPSVLQGEQAVEQIIFRLNQIRQVIRHFDVVAIIRGGGGDVGLSCYNHYDLAEAVACFPIPVLTGIGHSTNETVVEMVACENAITPTKLAEFLIQKFHNVSVPLQKAEETMHDMAIEVLDQSKEQFLSEVKLFRSVAIGLLSGNNHLIRAQAQALSTHTKLLISKAESDVELRHEGMKKEAVEVVSRAKMKLENYQKSISILDPVNTLKRGYSITRLNGKTIRSSDEAKKGDQISTSVFDGRIFSIVDKTDKMK